MTREESIKLASEKDLETNLCIGIKDPNKEDIRLCACGSFILGAKWADNNPVNPWHKASEELPEVPEKKKYVKVLTTLHHGSGFDFRILYFHKDFGFSKHKEYQNAYYKDRKTGCAHWMYIPEIEEGQI